MGVMGKHKSNKVDTAMKLRDWVGSLITVITFSSFIVYKYTALEIKTDSVSKEVVIIRNKLHEIELEMVIGEVS